MADNFKGMLKKAKDATKDKRNFGLGRVMCKALDYKQVLGEDFAAMVANGEPCGKFFLSQCLHLS